LLTSTVIGPCRAAVSSIARFKAAAIPRTGLRKAPLVIGQDIPVA